MEIIKEILLWVGIVAILVPFVCMCLMTIKDTIDYITDKGEELLIMKMLRSLWMDLLIT